MEAMFTGSLQIEENNIVDHDLLFSGLNLHLHKKISGTFEVRHTYDHGKVEIRCGDKQLFKDVLSEAYLTLEQLGFKVLRKPRHMR